MTKKNIIEKNNRKIIKTKQLQVEKEPRRTGVALGQVWQDRCGRTGVALGQVCQDRCGIRTGVALGQV